MRIAWRLFACTTIFLTGCSVTSIATKAPATAPDPTPATSIPISGMVHGGQQPIDKASVYMFAVTVGSYGQASNSLLKNTGLTDGNNRSYVQTANGVFKITSAEYTCNAGDQVYLYSVGGNASYGINSHAGLMAVLGQCGSGNSFTGLPATVQMNEVTTVAAAYALAGYATDATDMSGDQTGTTMAKAGLANAAATAGILANLSGQALAPGDVNGSNVQKQINTLADILAACINSSGAVSGPTNPTPCYTLLTNSLSGGTTGSQPPDTATAAINIVHYPGVARTTDFFNLSTSSPPFMPVLSSAPNDWTLAITWNALNGATFLAIDASGNVWATDDAAPAISERSPLGVNLSGTNGFSGGMPMGSVPTGIAIDDASPPNIWVTSAVESGVLTKINSTTPNSGTSTTAGANGLDYPYGVAIDVTGNIWVANVAGHSVSKFDASGNTLNNFQALDSNNNTQFKGPENVAIDPAGAGGGNIWVTNAGNVDGNDYGTTIVKLNNSGSPFTTSGGYSGGGILAPIDDALDHSGHVWISNFEGTSMGVNGSLTELSNADGSVIAGPITGGGVSGTYGGPYGIAVDGDGKVWTANLGPLQDEHVGSISAYNPSASAFLSPANGFQPGLNKPNGIAIDASGNVWVANNGDSNITELVGAAAPVVVPLVTGVKNNTLGTRP